MLHAESKALQNAMEKNSDESGIGEEILQKFLHTFWSTQKALGENFEVV